MGRCRAGISLHDSISQPLTLQSLLTIYIHEEKWRSLSKLISSWASSTFEWMEWPTSSKYPTKRGIVSIKMKLIDDRGNALIWVIWGKNLELNKHIQGSSPHSCLTSSQFENQGMGKTECLVLDVMWRRDEVTMHNKVNRP